jgi:methylmalonyl-CoA mutase N-terminal domain/subunit
MTTSREATTRPSVAAPTPINPETVTISGYVVDERYGPAAVEVNDPKDSAKPHGRIGEPGQFPYTRGVHKTMYRDRLWTMRQFAGFGSADDTNKRFKYLLSNAAGTKANTGLSTAFDLPTLMGRDSDDPLSAGEVGRCGVAISTIEDMHRLYADIPIGEVTVSQTINGPAAVIWAMYLAMAKERGIDWKTVGGTLQNDILKEFHSQNEFIYPPEASVKLVVDTIEFASQHLPKWNSVSISGYHIREAGSTATQELAFTLRDGMEYVEACMKRGLDVDSFGPRLSFFFNSHNEFFEEICKLRAARRIWALAMRDRYGAKNERSMLMRTHVQTAGCSLTEQQPPEQHRSRRLPGDGRRSRRMPEPPHRLDGRNVRSADRDRGARGAPHPADPRPRDRRPSHCRSARRLVVRRGPHRPHGSRRQRDDPRGR